MKMQLMTDGDLTGITALVAVNNNKVLTGNVEGEIRLWTLDNDTGSNDFTCDKVFSGHLDHIHYLTLLPNNRFLSRSADKTLRVWNINSGQCETVIKNNGSVPFGYSIVGLPNDLIAIAGNCSPAWEAFDIYSLNTGECIFREQGQLHRAYGMALGMVKGYLIVSGYCSGEISVWKVTSSECTQISKCDNERIYSMAVLPTQEIVTGGFNLNIFKLTDAGTIQLYKEIPNNNVIDDIIPLNPYRLLTVDRKNNAGTLKVWDYLEDTSEIIGSSKYASDNLTYSHAASLGNNTILSIMKGKICLQHFPTLNYMPKDIAEIRKNARLLAQAGRTNSSFFASLPKELNIKIAALTSNSNEEKISEKIALDHFSKPF